MFLAHHSVTASLPVKVVSVLASGLASIVAGWEFHLGYGISTCESSKRKGSAFPMRILLRLVLLAEKVNDDALLPSKNQRSVYLRLRSNNYF
jgi:hypothetical protein